MLLVPLNVASVVVALFESIILGKLSPKSELSSVLLDAIASDSVVCFLKFPENIIVVQELPSLSVASLALSSVSKDICRSLIVFCLKLESSYQHKTQQLEIPVNAHNLMRNVEVII